MESVASWSSASDRQPPAVKSKPRQGTWSAPDRAKGLHLAVSTTHQILAICPDRTPFCLIFNFGMLFATHTGATTKWRKIRGEIMDPKIALLFVLIGTVIVLSHLSDENLGRVRRQFAAGRWREIVPRRRRA